MRALASFIMRGPWQAALVAVVTTVLLPPFFLLSGAAIALVTLRLGWQQGLLVSAIATSGGALLTWLMHGSAMWMLMICLLYWLPLLGLAVVLRATMSLAITLRVAIVLGVLAVFAIFVLFGSPEVWWAQFINEGFSVPAQSLTSEQKEIMQLMQQMLLQITPIVPGLSISSLLLALLLALLLGRWWQALLYNPGGFRAEFHSLRLGKVLAIIMLLLLAFSVLSALLPMVNLMLIVGIVYILQGIALVHALVAKIGLSKAWLIAFYVLLVLWKPIPQLTMILGAVDAWADLRTRLPRPSNKE